LRQLLAQHKSHIFSLIQKFNQDVDPDHGYSQRDDIIVITDEAHRTQYGTLALNMRNALPNASYIGFTGTPLFKDDEITRRVFGDYVSTYDFQRAVNDEATVPLYYDARGDKLGVAVREGLDEESLALFDLLKKPDLRTADTKKIKKVAVELLETLKAEKLKIDHWRDKETTRDMVRITIKDFLWSDNTGLPVDSYTEEEVTAKAENVFLHVFNAYPTVPSPFYAEAV